MILTSRNSFLLDKIFPQEEYLFPLKSGWGFLSEIKSNNYIGFITSNVPYNKYYGVIAHSIIE